MALPMRRAERRILLKIAVDLESLDARERVKPGTTENVSGHGARVLSRHPWRPNARVNIRSLHGNLQSHARVAYCQSLGRGTFAIGLELFAPAGSWTRSGRLSAGESDSPEYPPAA